MNMNPTTYTNETEDAFYEKGWTLRTAARVLGVNFSHLHRVITGTRISQTLLDQVSSLPNATEYIPSPEDAEKRQIISDLEKLQVTTQGHWNVVAAMIGVTPSMLYQVKSGKKRFSQKALYRLKEALAKLDSEPATPSQDREPVRNAEPEEEAPTTSEEYIRKIQRAVGTDADGVFGPVTRKAVLRQLDNGAKHAETIRVPLTETATAILTIVTEEEGLGHIDPAFARPITLSEFDLAVRNLSARKYQIQPEH